MRGKKKNIKSICASGNVYIRFLDDENIENAILGDFLLYLSLERGHARNELFYNQKGCKGYLKLEVFDGYKWCFVNIQEFFENKEFHFSKTEMPIYTLRNCQEVLQPLKDTKLFKTYREHYTTQEYIQENEFKGKKYK